LTDRQCVAQLRAHAKERASAFDCRQKATEVLTHLERAAASVPR
jgi:hypothetical protein